MWAAEPTFPLAVEIHSRGRWLVHGDVAQTVDLLLRGQSVRPQVRELDGDGRLRVQEPPGPTSPRQPPSPSRGGDRSRPRLAAVPLPPLEPREPAPGNRAATAPGQGPLPTRQPDQAAGPLRVYGAAIPRGLMEQVVRARQLPVQVAGSVELADVVLAVRQQLGRDPHVRRLAQELGLPILVIKSAALPQLQRGLERLVERHRQPAGAPAAPDAGLPGDPDDDLAALEECRLAVERVVLAQGQPVELLPRSARVRQLQAELADRYRLRTAVFGHADQQRLRVFPA